MDTGGFAEPDVVCSHAVENLLRGCCVLLAQPHEDGLRAWKLRTRDLLCDLEVDLSGFKRPEYLRERFVDGGGES